MSCGQARKNVVIVEGGGVVVKVSEHERGGHTASASKPPLRGISALMGYPPESWREWFRRAFGAVTRWLNMEYENPYNAPGYLLRNQRRRRA